MVSSFGGDPSLTFGVGSDVKGLDTGVGGRMRYRGEEGPTDSSGRLCVNSSMVKSLVSCFGEGFRDICESILNE